MRRTFWLALLILCPISALNLPAASESTSPATAAELYFKPPEFNAPAISPDGKNIAFIARSDGHACLFRLDLQTGQVSGIFSAGQGDVEAFWWTSSQRVLLAARGSENLQYFVQDLATSKPRSLDTLHNWDSDWIKIIPNDPDHIVGFNKRIDLTTGKYKLIEYASADDVPVFSSAGETRAKLWSEMGKWHITWRAGLKDSWKSITSDAEQQPPFIPVDVASDDVGILVIANDQGNTQALMRLDPITGQRTLIAQRPDHDITHLIRVGPDRRPVGVEFVSFGAQDVFYFEPADEQFSAALDQSLPGMLHRVTSMSTDGTRKIIAAWVPGYPFHYYLFDQVKKQLSMLGDQRPDLAQGVLGEVKVFKFKTRDGLDEIGYAVLPQSPGPGQFPVIVRAVDGAGDPLTSPSMYNAQDQFFVSRGYVVAHVAVRGTPGFGRTFQTAGDFELGHKVVDDLEDAVGFLVKTGRIDPRRVAILGDGLGALSALHSAAVSTAFRAVIAYNPRCELTATSIGWLSSSRADTPTIVKQAGGTKAAYALIHEFDPDVFLDKLSAPTLLMAITSYGWTGNADAKHIRGCFDHHKKAYEWFELDTHDWTHVKNETYVAQINTKIANYLDQTMR